MADLALSVAPGSEQTAGYGDLQFGPTGDLLLTDGLAAIRQCLLLRLHAATGDYFMAPNEGIGWLEMLGGIGGYSDAFDAVLRNTVLGTPGVEGLLGWQVAAGASREVVLVQMDVATAQGTINFSLPVSQQEGT